MHGRLAKAPCSCVLGFEAILSLSFRPKLRNLPVNVFADHSCPCLLDAPDTSSHCSLPVPFYGDRLSLRSDPRWSKLAAEHNETRVVWADNIIKINRHDGKVRVV